MAADNGFRYMEEACLLAEKGMERGDGGPFGAVIVRGDTIVGRGWNRVLRTNDPTAHAEISAIRDACLRLGEYHLQSCHIYVNCEPCPMCLAAIYWARIEKLTYGASRLDAAGIGFDDAMIYEEVCLPLEKQALQIRQMGREKSLAVMRLWPDTGKSY